MSSNAPAPKGKQPVGLASRRSCFRILQLVDAGRHLDEALQTAGNLPDRDRRFVRLLATTCLRRAGQIDRILNKLMDRRPAGKQRHANIVLSMGVAQLLFLETDGHAAVNSTVELMRAEGFDRLTGMTNAIMRRLTREGNTLLAATNPSHNLPGWLAKSWTQQFGASAVASIMDLAMLPPPLDISPAADPEGWATRLEGQLINRHTIRRGFEGDLTDLDGFAEGAWWVQDAAAAFPVSLFGDLQGRQAIDMCAAPGGKTAQLIAAGAQVTAIDSSRKRIKRLQTNLDRLGMTAELVVADGRNHTPPEPVDAVLIDAPCSATGTLRRRPDVLRNRQQQDIGDLVPLQTELVKRAASWLKPGGSLIYATCSLQFEEGEDIVDAVLADPRIGLALEPVKNKEAGIFAPAITKAGTVRLRPDLFADIGGVDGFFVARFRAKAG